MGCGLVQGEMVYRGGQTTVGFEATNWFGKVDPNGHYAKNRRK